MTPSILNICAFVIASSIQYGRQSAAIFKIYFKFCRALNHVNFYCRMKLWPILRQAARLPAKEPFPFQELLPLKLKTTVSGKGDKTSDIGCLQEMAVLFASFKKNDFNQSLSAKEIESFEKSYKLYLDKKRIKKEQERKGILTPGVRDLSHKQINQLLKNFPQ